MRDSMLGLTEVHLNHNAVEPSYYRHIAVPYLPKT
jgi:hypothetical protein